MSPHWKTNFFIQEKKKKNHWVKQVLTNKQTNKPTNQPFVSYSLVYCYYYKYNFPLTLSYSHFSDLKKKKKIVNPKSLSSDGREMGADGDGADSDEHSGDQVLGQEGRNPHPSCQ